MRLNFIHEHLAGEFPADLCCQMPAVSRSGYHAWAYAQPSAISQQLQDLAEKIRTVHVENRNGYESPRVPRALLNQGPQVSENTVAKAML